MLLYQLAQYSSKNRPLKCLSGLYHHILDTGTGYPAENDLTQVTIISPYSADGDALSTTCFVLGLTDGMALVESMGGIEAVFMTADGELHFTSGFGDELTFE